jgi:hypothetical protein
MKYDIPDCENEDCPDCLRGYYNRCAVTAWASNPKFCKGYKPHNKAVEPDRASGAVPCTLCGSENTGFVCADCASKSPGVSL